jgi:hypothetical protein
MSFTRSGGAPPPWYTAMPVVQVTSSYSAQVTDYYIGVNGTGVTVTLPLGSSTYVGKTYVVKDESGKISVNALFRVTVATSGPDLVDGQQGLIIALDYGAVNILWTGSNWSIF